MKRQTLIILTVLTSLTLIAACLTYANEFGNISGQISDSQTGQPIVGATVFLVGTNRVANTDLEGKFVIKRIEPGTYTIQVSAVGYQKLELRNVEVKSETTVSIKNSLTAMSEKTIELEVGKAETDNGKIYTRSDRAGEVGNSRDTFVPDATSFYTPPPVNERKVKREVYTYFPPPYNPIYPNNDAFDDMFFENYGTNPFISTENDYQSTFGIDIDDASYTLSRSYLEQSTLPPTDAIRVEEFINHFNYKYQPPSNETFAVHMEGAPSRFGQGSQLLRIGIKGKNVDVESRQPANTVFVVDVSGSMSTGNRIVLVIETLKHIINRANYSDQIGIVAYNQTAEVILESTSARYKNKLLAAVDRLFPYGRTNVQAGLRLGYQMASRHFDPKKSNRVILFSDGVANVGVTDAETLLKETRKYAKQGITLSSIGVGMGNYNDVLMEKLGDKGNGFYAYIDSFDEARRVFDGDLSGALQVIARDVKIQVEFDPEVVQSYRLLGYENRAVADYNFRNDKVDGGEVGPGHAATALYEINLKNFRRIWHNDSPDGESIGRVLIRYKNPQSGTIEEISKPIASHTFKRQFSRTTPQFKLAAAAAEFAEVMRDSYWARNSNLDDVLRLADQVYRQTSDEEVQEFVSLIATARHLRNTDSDYFSRE